MLPIIQVSKSKTERSTMPQIDNTVAFLKFCESHGVRHRKVVLSAQRLKPRQNDINLNTVFQIISSGLDTERYPVLVANSEVILDGHHRWYSGKVQMVKITCYHLRASETKLLRIAALFGAKHKTIDTKGIIT